MGIAIHSRGVGRESQTKAYRNLIKFHRFLLSALEMVLVETGVLDGPGCILCADCPEASPYSFVDRICRGGVSPSVMWDGKPVPYAAASNIFSINIPYPVVGSFTRT